MILVIGGHAAGKKDWVKHTMHYEDSRIAEGVLDQRPVLNSLQMLVLHCIRQGDEPQRLLPWLLEKQVVVCDEMGCGVVPVDEVQNRLREETGRLCVLLAQHAEKVVRITCGIPQVIKG